MGCSLSSIASSPRLSDYHISEKIGEGGFATLYQAHHKRTNSLVAMKVIDIQKCCSRRCGADMLKGELESLKTVPSHPFIARLYYAFHDYSSCYLIFELLEGGDLRYYLNTEYCFTEKVVAFFAGCLGSALHHIHSHGVLHRDVKPENIIFDTRGYPKLIDFGIAYVCPDDSMVCTNCSGTRLYSAPELFTPSHAHGAAADFWALGIVLYEMLYLAHPFKHHCPREFMKFATRYAEIHKPLKDARKASDLSTDFSTSVLSKNRYEVVLTDERLKFSPENNVLAFIDGTDDRSRLGDNENTYKSQRGGGPVSENPDDDDFDVISILPPHLRVTLPLTTAYGDVVSFECHGFLNELLDLRPHRRLGTEERYVDFVHNDWLISNDIHVLNLVHQNGSHLLPPLIKVNSEGYKSYTFTRFEHSERMIPQSTSVSKPKLSNKFWKRSNLIFPNEHPAHIMDILNSYHYVWNQEY